MYANVNSNYAYEKLQVTTSLKIVFFSFQLMCQTVFFAVSIFITTPTRFIFMTI